MLLSTGIFWDDWSIIGVSQETLKDQFINNGVTIGYYFHLPFWKLGSPWVYHLLTFILYGITYLLVGKILRAKPFNIASEKAWTTVFILDVLPFNESKITAICSFYTVSIFLFVLGFYLFHCRTDLKWKILGAVSILLSFLTPSISFYYIIVLLVTAAIEYCNSSFTIWIKRTVIHGFKKYGLYGLIAILSFVAYKSTFKPNEVSQAGYNQISNNQILRMPIEMVKVTYINGIEFYQQIGKLAKNHWLLVIILGMCTTALMYSKRNQSKDKQSLWIFLAGLVLWFMAMVPYIAVGKLPTFYEHLARHHLLTPIGFSLMVVGGLYVLKGWYFRLGFNALIVFFASITFTQYLNYQAEDLKMKWLGNELSEKSTIAKENTFIIDDRAEHYKSNENPNRYYSWAGLLHQFTGKQDKFMGTEEELEYTNNYPEKYCLAEFNMKDYVPEMEADAHIVIFDQPLDDWKIFKSYFSETEIKLIYNIK